MWHFFCCTTHYHQWRLRNLYYTTVYVWDTVLKASSKLHYPPLSCGQSLDLATSVEAGKNFKSSLSSRRVAISMQRQDDIRLGQRDAEVPGLCWRDPTRRRNEGEAPDGKRCLLVPKVAMIIGNPPEIPKARTSSMSTGSRSRRVDWCSRRTLWDLAKKLLVFAYWWRTAKDFKMLWHLIIPLM